MAILMFGLTILTILVVLLVLLFNVYKIVNPIAREAKEDLFREEPFVFTIDDNREDDNDGGLGVK